MNTKNKLAQPTLEDISEKLQKIDDGKLSREQVAYWARGYMENEKRVVKTDSFAWCSLVIASMLDMMTDDNRYVYDVEDLRYRIAK